MSARISFFVLLALRLERVVQQLLVFHAVRKFFIRRQFVIRLRHERIKREQVQQQRLFAALKFEPERFAAAPEKFHRSSRSSVALSVYFWSW